MDSSKVKAIIIVVVAVFISLYLGIAAATAQQEAISWVIGVGGFTACILLGRKIWLLIPFLGAMQLTLLIPGKPTTMLFAQALVGGFSVLMFLTRKLRFRLRFTESEFWILALSLCLLQVYVRNPVSLNILGGDAVGGRPYFLFVTSLFTGVLLCGLLVPASELRTAMRLGILGGILNFGIGLAGMFFPGFGMWFGAAGGPNQSSEGVVDDTRATRIEGVRAIAQTLALTVSSFINPLRACFSLRWAPLILLSMAFAALSGYRNVFGSLALTYLVGLFYHGRLASVIAAGLLGAAFVALLAVGNLVMPLPANVQRTLSFLPGTWDEDYKRDGAASTEWRVEIWKEVLLTDRWIHNKLFGDGLGFTASELAMQQAVSAKKDTGRMGVSGFDTHRESILANGDYHSGPVSAIRTIGYFGLLVMAMAQLRLVVLAHRQIMRCKGTEWFPVALFFCIPIVWNPAFFWLIFGGFGSDGPAILMAAGMIRLLENNLPLPAYAGARRFPVPLATHRVHADAARPAQV